MTVAPPRRRELALRGLVPDVAPPESPEEISVFSWARSLKALLPPGAAWDLEVDSTLSKTLVALAGEFTRVDGRGEDLLNEADPRTADETIGDWETLLGLPDNCLGVIPTLLVERQAAVSAKYIARGGQDRDFYTRVALALGFTIAIQEFYGDVLRCGFRSGDRCKGIAWVHTWRPFTSTAAELGVDFLDPPGFTSCTRLLTFGGSLAAATNYSYVITAINQNGDFIGETVRSNQLSRVPGGFTNTNQLLLLWTAVAGATGYRIYADRGGGGFKKIGETAAGVLTFVDTGAPVPFGLEPATNTAWKTPLPARVLAFECVMRRAAPGHSLTIFAFSK